MVLSSLSEGFAGCPRAGMTNPRRAGSRWKALQKKHPRGHDRTDTSRVAPRRSQRGAPSRGRYSSAATNALQEETHEAARDPRPPRRRRGTLGHHPAPPSRRQGTSRAPWPCAWTPTSSGSSRERSPPGSWSRAPTARRPPPVFSPTRSPATGAASCATGPGNQHGVRHRCRPRARGREGRRARCCFECDELYTVRVLPKMRPDALVLLNLFRDSWTATERSTTRRT